MFHRGTGYRASPSQAVITSACNRWVAAAPRGSLAGILMFVVLKPVFTMVMVGEGARQVRVVGILH